MISHLGASQSSLGGLASFWYLGHREWPTQQGDPQSLLAIPGEILCLDAHKSRSWLGHTPGAEGIENEHSEGFIMPLSGSQSTHLLREDIQDGVCLRTHLTWTAGICMFHELFTLRISTGRNHAKLSNYLIIYIHEMGIKG